MVLGVIGNLAGNNQPKKVGENKQSTNSSSTSSKSTTKIFKIGDVIELKDYKVTVNKIRISSGENMITPKAGNEFFYVDCTIENISKEEKVISSVMMFKVEDQDGRSYEQAITGDQNGQLDRKVGVGQKISGEYVVEVPQGKTGLRLVFDSSVIGTGGQVIVKLN